MQMSAWKMMLWEAKCFEVSYTPRGCYTPQQSGEDHDSSAYIFGCKDSFHIWLKEQYPKEHTESFGFSYFLLLRVLVSYVVSNNVIMAEKLKQISLIAVINVGLAALCPEWIQRCTVKSISQMPVKGRSLQWRAFALIKQNRWCWKGNKGTHRGEASCSQLISGSSQTVIPKLLGLWTNVSHQYKSLCTFSSPLKCCVCDMSLQISGHVMDHRWPTGSGLRASALDAHQHAYFCTQELHTKESFTFLS